MEHCCLRIAPGHTAEGTPGSAFVTFQWTDQGELTFVNPSPDVTQVSGSPCEVAERVPQLGTVVAGHELDGECLRAAGTFAWGGTTRWVYRVTD